MLDVQSADHEGKITKIYASDIKESRVYFYR